MDDTEWHPAALAYVTRVCKGEYQSQIRSHRGSAKKFRYTPSQYVEDLLDCIKRNDEEGFKATKMVEGYASSIGV